MSWITISKDHLKARLTAAELECYVDAADQQQNGVDVIDGILSQITSMVRGKVASNRDNLEKMGPTGTIPDECLFAACTIARDALVGSLPLSEGSTEVRKEELRKAHAFLDDVAKGDVRIENNAGVIPESDSTSSPMFGGNVMLDF